MWRNEMGLVGARSFCWAFVLYTLEALLVELSLRLHSNVYSMFRHDDVLGSFNTH